MWPPHGLRRHRPRRLFGSLIAAVGIMTLAIPVARADLEWQMRSVVSTTIFRESNPESVPDDIPGLEKDDAWIGTLQGNLNFAGQSQRWRHEIEPRYTARESWGNDGNKQLDGDEVGVNAFTQWQSEKMSASLRGFFLRTPSREADFQVANSDTGQFSGSGLGCTVEIAVENRCNVDEYQDRWYLAPDWSLLINPRLSLGIGSAVEVARYSEAEITARVDYENYVGNATLTRTLSPQQQVSGTVEYTYFRSQQPVSAVQGDDSYRLESKSHSVGGQLGYLNRLRADTTLTVNLGASFSSLRYSGLETTDGLPCFNGEDEFVACSQRSEDTNFIGNILLRRQVDERISAQLSASRQLQPGGDGAQVVADNFGGLIDHEFTQKLRGSTSAFYTKQKALDDGAEGIYGQRFDRDYFRFEVGLNWQFLRDWTLQLQWSHYLDKQEQTITQLGNSQTFEVDQDNNIALLRFQYGKTLKLNGF